MEEIEKDVTYRVTIEKLSRVHSKKKEYCRIRNVPDDLKKKPGFYRENEGDDPEHTRSKDLIEEYGSVEVEEFKNREVNIFTQTLVDMDVQAVVKAVNKI